MPVFQKRSLPDEATTSDGASILFQRCHWQVDGQSDILEQVEVSRLGAEDRRSFWFQSPLPSVWGLNS
jgi:hypothetical protein